MTTKITDWFKWEHQLAVPLREDPELHLEKQSNHVESRYVLQYVFMMVDFSASTGHWKGLETPAFCWSTLPETLPSFLLTIGNYCFSFENMSSSFVNVLLKTLLLHTSRYVLCFHRAKWWFILDDENDCGVWRFVIQSLLILNSCWLLF